MKKISILFIIIIVLANVPPAKWLAGPDDIAYSNSNGTFTLVELNTSGRNYKYCLDVFKAFKATQTKDTVLFRLTSINILEFWRWGDYLLKKKYKLPYRSWDEIEALRGRIENKTNWQDF